MIIKEKQVSYFMGQLKVEVNEDHNQITQDVD